MLIIGDVHNDFDKYYDLVKDKESSVQLGDFGTSAWTKLHYSDLNPNKHKVLGGNHDDYDVAPLSSYYLGDFGMCDLGFYFIRGGYSIDGSILRLSRKREGKSWWGDEQLNYVQMRRCEDDYLAKKPKVVITHTPPNFIIQKISSPKIMEEYGYDSDFKCQTSQFLEYLFKLHQPEMWYFGHMHKTYHDMIRGSIFIGLAPLEALDVRISECRD
jgi:hypothetical protein